MTIRNLSLIGLLVAGFAFFLWQDGRLRGLRRPAEAAAVSPLAPEDEAGPSASNSSPGRRQLGPFTIQGRAYLVILQEMRQGSGDQDASSTVTQMEIQDTSGDVQYSRSFSVSESNPFSDSWGVSAQSFSGATGSGLLVTYSLNSEISAPTPEESSWWQLFGVIDGKLIPFSGPLSVEGALLPAREKSDVLQFKVWAHHFRILYPVAIDWSSGKLSPSCAACEYRVLPEDLDSREDLTFVQMCSGPLNDCDMPTRTLVKRDSTIDLVAARVDVHWSEGSPESSPPDSSDSMSDSGEITVGEPVSLKVRIDGVEGWLHAEEDYLALSLPFEQ